MGLWLWFGLLVLPVQAPPALQNLLVRLQVAEPLSFGEVAFYPLRLPGAENDSRIFITLGEALQEGWLVLSEETPMQQNSLWLRPTRQFFPGGYGLFGGGIGGPGGLGFGAGGFGFPGGGIPGGGLGYGFGGFFGPGGGLFGGGFQGRGLGQGFFGGGSLFGSAPSGRREEFRIAMRSSSSHPSPARRSWEEGWTLPVFCLEPFRSGGPSPFFTGGDLLAPVRVRAQMLMELSDRNQKEVWAVAQEELRRFGLYSPSRALGALYEAPQTAAPAQEVADVLLWHPGWGKDAVGLIAFAGGKVLGIEVFANPLLFEKMRRPLLMAYALDAWEAPPAPLPKPEALQAWLPRFAQARATQRPAVGDGEFYLLTAPGWIGSLMLYEEGIIHWAMFPLASPSGR